MLVALRNILKVWLLVLVLAGVLGARRLGARGFRLLSIFVFAALLMALRCVVCSTASRSG